MLNAEYTARVDAVKRRAHGRWTEILGAMGIHERMLKRKPMACPVCRDGEDRFQYTDKFGEGNYHCRKCGPGGGFKLLGLQTYFTAGVKEVRAWTVPIGATAPQAAGVIHGDFERGFIRAQTIAFDDYIALKGEQGAKDAGKMRAEGKEYIVKDGDVLNFLFNV